MSAKPRGASSFRTWCGLGNGSSGLMWSPLLERPPRSVAPASTSSGHQSARFGGTWTPTSGIRRFDSAINRFMSSIETGVAQSGRGRSEPLASSPSHLRLEASSAISATSAP